MHKLGHAFVSWLCIMHYVSYYIGYYFTECYIVFFHNPLITSPLSFSLSLYLSLFYFFPLLLRIYGRSKVKNSLHTTRFFEPLIIINCIRQTEPESKYMLFSLVWNLQNLQKKNTGDKITFKTMPLLIIYY